MTWQSSSHLSKALWAIGSRCARASVLAFVLTQVGSAQGRTKNVVLIVTDGLRWQEVFRGAERALMSRQPGGVGDTTRLLQTFWRDGTAERRTTLLPFLWGKVAKEGQLFGNADAGEGAAITNRFKFSYPGYNEILTGAYDPRIDSNDYPPNPNVTVFEWLARQPAFNGRVAALATWSAFRRIFNKARAGIDVMDGWDPPFHGPAALTPQAATINAFYRNTIHMWGDNVFDAHMHLAAKEYVRTKKPRVLFLGYGETDEWAHAGRYDMLLQSANRVDSLIADMWNTMQRMPEYRGSTTFIITTDHGRGDGLEEWKNHGERVAGAERIWIGLLGPDTPPLGEMKVKAGQNQIAATLAAMLGRDFVAAFPNAGSPIASALPAKR